MDSAHPMCSVLLPSIVLGVVTAAAALHIGGRYPPLGCRVRFHKFPSFGREFIDLSTADHLGEQLLRQMDFTKESPQLGANGRWNSGSSQADQVQFAQHRGIAKCCTKRRDILAHRSTP